MLTLLVAAATAHAAAGAATVDLDKAVDAIWRVRSITFHFQSPTTYYYCDILQQRVVDIMRAVGAGQRMDVKARCSVGSLINDTTIRIVAGVPIEATTENVLAETTFSTETELIARSHNWELPTPTTVRRFRAIRTEISFARLADLHLTPNDCDLLQAMSDQVFPKLDIRSRDVAVLHSRFTAVDASRIDRGCIDASVGGGCRSSARSLATWPHADASGSLTTGRTWLITGATGFIGGHLVRALQHAAVIA